EFTPAEEIDRIREEFQTLTQTNETVNEMWKKFNDLIRCCPEYHGNEKLKVERFQSMLRDDIREVISLFKCTTLDDLLTRPRVREADLLRKKNKEAKETKGKIEFGDRDAKKPKHDQGRKSGGTQSKKPCKKRHKTHLRECQANLLGCYKCGALTDMTKPLKSVKEEKVKKAGISNSRARVYMMVTEEDKVKPDVVTDAGYMYDPHTGRSQTGYVFTSSNTAISRRFVKQTISATSSNHAEILAIHEAIQECIWLRNAIKHICESCRIFSSHEAPTVLHEDNTTCIAQLKDGYIKGDRTKP
ncbi:zinc finger, CCHC-type, retrotransposon gag domain protein, partial [Tanacetum coccineum]